MHATEGEEAGDTVADGELRRDVQPLVLAGIWILPQIERPRRHVEELLTRQIRAVLRGTNELVYTHRHNTYGGTCRTITSGALTWEMQPCSIVIDTSGTVC